MGTKTWGQRKKYAFIKELSMGVFNQWFKQFESKIATVKLQAFYDTEIKLKNKNSEHIDTKI